LREVKGNRGKIKRIVYFVLRREGDIIPVIFAGLGIGTDEALWHFTEQ
jgi:hypothetical protein